MNIPLEMLRGFLYEDAPFGDLTTESVVGNRPCRAVIRAHRSGVVAGLEEAETLWRYLDVQVREPVHDGDRVGAETALMVLEGDATAILLAERTVLNIIGRMSGIATRTRSLVDRVKAINPRCHIASTRKTAPGLRLLDKKAVQIGGGETHRFSLSDMILIKDNHLILVSLEQALQRARTRTPYHGIEVEVNTPEAALEAVRAGADGVMLDNMDPTTVAATLVRLREENLRDRVYIEVSGGITEDTIDSYAALDIDVISLGVLTHTVRNFDVSLEIV